MHIIDQFISFIFLIISKVPAIIISILVAWLVIKVILYLTKRSLRIAKTPKDTSRWTIRIVKILLWATFIIIAAGSLGLGNIAIALSGSAAIVAFFLSVSIGPTLSNIFSGMFLSGDSDLKVGMKIITNSGNTKGVVKSMDMRKIRVEDDKGVLHVLPNSVVENGEWIVVERNTKINK